VSWADTISVVRQVWEKGKTYTRKSISLNIADSLTKLSAGATTTVKASNDELEKIDKFCH